MRCTPFWPVLAVLALGCELDTSPGDGATIGASDGAIGALDGGPGAGDAGDAGPAGDAASAEDAGHPPAASPCGGRCPDDAPVCLAPSQRCVQCAADRDCEDELLPACDRDAHACVQCTDDDHCAGDTPRCDTTARTCVQCVADQDCGDPERARCDPASLTCVRCLGDADCSAETPACDVEAHACVECVTHAHCPSPAQPQCEANACVPCTGEAACEGREQATVCDLAAGSPTAGSCVECTVDAESPCGGTVCDPQARRCTDRLLASRQVCEPCIADSECAADHRCIALQFGGVLRAQAYCMKRLASGCARPYASAPIRRASRSGAPEEDYCGIDEQKTTCEAIAALLMDLECADGSDASCGREGSQCRTVNGLAQRCTYACDAAAQCPPAFACGSGGYCGGANGSD